MIVTAVRYPGPVLRVGELPPVRAAFDAFPLAGGVGYIRFTAFVPALEDALRVAIGRFRAAPGLILDLRGNPGGSDLLGDHLAAMLVLQPRELTETRTRVGVRVDRASPTGSGYGLTCWKVPRAYFQILAGSSEVLPAAAPKRI